MWGEFMATEDIKEYLVDMNIEDRLAAKKLNT